MSSSEWIKRKERCGIENCRSRRYQYNENGYLTCENGHQHFELVRGEDEGDFGAQGRVTRRKREEREAFKQHYEGRRAFQHYLECYQLVLRKQLWWLIHSKGLPAELEQIVYDLWSYRLRALTSRSLSHDDTDNDTDGPVQLFSSQTETETETERESGPGRRGRAKDSTPRLLDAIGLCYLGINLLQLPITAGDLYNWIQHGELLYYKAKKELPKIMMDKLPGQYHPALDPTKILAPGKLQIAVLDLVISLHRDFGMEFPKLNYPLHLFRWIKELGLPLEVYVMATWLANLLGYDLSYPSGRQQRIQQASFPETQLLSLLVVSVKLLYPFDTIPRHATSLSDLAATGISWGAWGAAHDSYEAASSELQRKKDGGVRYEDAAKMTEDDVYSMNEEAMDAYLDWYERTMMEEVEPTGPRIEFHEYLYKLFPTGHDAPEVSRTLSRTPDVGTEGDRTSSAPSPLPSISPLPPQSPPLLKPPQSIKLHAAQSTLHLRPIFPFGQEPANGVKRPGSHYSQHRRTEDLDGHALTFYKAAAKLGGLEVGALVRATFGVERKMQWWVKTRAKEKSEREKGEKKEDIEDYRGN